MCRNPPTKHKFIKVCSELFKLNWPWDKRHNQYRESFIWKANHRKLFTSLRLIIFCYFCLLFPLKPAGLCVCVYWTPFCMFWSFFPFVKIIEFGCNSLSTAIPSPTHPWGSWKEEAGRVFPHENYLFLPVYKGMYVDWSIYRKHSCKKIE